MRMQLTVAAALVIAAATSERTAHAAGVLLYDPQPVQPGPLAGELAPVPMETPADIAGRQTARRAVKIGTAAMLGVNAGIGVILALNKGTVLSQGLCHSADSRPIFGGYGCDELGLVHGATAITSLAGYTAGNVLDATTPRPPPKLPGLHRAVTYVHLGGMVAAPVLGLLSRYPTVVGLRQSEDLQRNLRTVHIGTALLTATAYAISMGLDF
ncbi:MAG: hypothetical protein QM820_33900 [Minicystis sp.]